MPATIRGVNPERPKVLLVFSNGAEVMDTLYLFFRLGKDYRMVVAAPQRRVVIVVTVSVRLAAFIEIRGSNVLLGSRVRDGMDELQIGFDRPTM